MDEMTVQAALADINDTLDSLHAFLDGNLAVEYVGMLHRGISNLLAAVLVQQMAQNDKEIVTDSHGQSQKPWEIEGISKATYYRRKREAEVEAKIYE